MPTNNKIFVVGGGTGGHLFPAISAGQELIKRGYEVHLITDDRCMKYLGAYRNAFIIHIINSSGFKSGVLAKVMAIFKVFSALVKTFLLLYKEKPALVMTFGGYVAFSPLLCANMMDIPTAIHEQNCFFGKVNKWFANRANNILLTFKETNNIPDGNDNKIIVSGNPVREEISGINIKKNFKSNPFKIVIIGGSQGAKVFSDLVPQAIEIAVQRHKGIDLEVIQQAKSEDIEVIKAIYISCKVKCEVSDFFYNIPEILSSAHLVIARSGASTIAELVQLACPAFFVPFPFAAEKHQDFNADVIAKNGGGWWLDQSVVTAQIIADKIVETYEDRGILEEVSKNLTKLKTDSVNIIANVAEKIIASSKK